ncbi:MAG: LPS export ABC transporter permease LptG [Nitrospirales bacterium]|nr:LPS export ABC transporter permease LptG [Nitrospirales bacterium]
MGLIFRYILRQYLQIFLLCQAGLTAVYLLVEFFEKLRKFLRYDAELFLMLKYFFFKIPEITFTLSPMTTLMATLLTLGLLNKNQEITALRSCGFSLTQIIAPFIVIGVVVSLSLLSFTAVVIPLSNAQAEHIKTVEIKKKPQPQSLTSTELWLRIKTDSIMKIAEVAPNGSTLHTIELYHLDDHFQLDSLIEAQSAHYQDGWILNTVTQRHFASDGHVTLTTYATQPLALSMTPKDFQAWLSMKPDRMTLAELQKHIDRLAKDGHSTDRFVTDYWGRVAFSLVSLMMTVLGIALGLMKTGRRGTGIAKGIGQAMGISFLFWVMHSVGIALGRSGAVMPVLAGWLACFMLLALSLNLFLKVRY